MREINRALAVVQRALEHTGVSDAASTKGPTSEAAADQASNRSERYFGQRLNDADLDEIVKSMNTPGFAGSFARYLVYGLAVGWRFLLTLPPGRPHTTDNTVTGVVLWSAVFVHGIHTGWFRKR